MFGSGMHAWAPRVVVYDSSVSVAWARCELLDRVSGDAVAAVLLVLRLLDGGDVRAVLVTDAAADAADLVGVESGAEVRTLLPFGLEPPRGGEPCGLDCGDDFAERGGEAVAEEEIGGTDDDAAVS